MFYYNLLEETLKETEHALKVLLYEKDNHVFDKIDFENEEIYLEPLLYAYLNQKSDFWFDTITLYYQKKGKKIKTRTNHNGIIYLPKICYLKTAFPNTELTLEILNDGSYSLLLNNKEVAFEREELLILDCGIEVIRYYHPLFDIIYKDELKVTNDITIEGVGEKHIQSMNLAFQLFEKLNFESYTALKKNVKKILLFEGEKPYSFASLSVHNMIFLNTKPNNNEIFFLEHIAHEGGHVLFNTLTFKTKKEIFTVPYNTPFKEVSGIEWEHADTYSRFHGLFTFTEITSNLLAAYNSNLFSGIKLHELKGRILFILTRYELQLESFEIKDLYTKEGTKWMNCFRETFNKAKHLLEELDKELTLNKQPYDFDFDIFLEKNPIEN